MNGTDRVWVLRRSRRRGLARPPVGRTQASQSVRVAATVVDMVQLTAVHAPKLWQPWLPDEARSYSKCKELPLTPVTGGKWRRERRQRLPPPDYPHKTAQSSHAEPLDMSTRRPRGSPPSYSQSLSFVRRPTVITTVQPPTGVVEDGGVCDPVIDEHFRRSLGKDYMSVFAHNGKQKHTRLVAEQPSDLTSSSLSVDDHFAKALGDTWLKLQKREPASSELRHRANTSVTI